MIDSALPSQTKKELTFVRLSFIDELRRDNKHMDMRAFVSVAYALSESRPDGTSR
jgi:hypothetical protein